MYNNTFLSNCMSQPLLPLTTTAYQSTTICQPNHPNALIPLTLSTFQGTSVPCLWFPNVCYTLIYNLTQNYLFDLPFIDSPREFTFEKNCVYFCITFFPSVFPSSALKTDSSLIQMLSVQPTFADQISCFLSIFNPELHLDFPPLIIRQILTAIATTNASITIQELSETLSYSERHICRVFHSYMNYSPKMLSRILRFQSSLQEILKMPDRNNSEYIKFLTYSDQAHFQREFKFFTTMTPRRFIQLIQNI